MCKGGDVFSLAVLIDRGLDLVFRVVPSFPGCPTSRSSSLLFPLCSVLRALSLNIVGADGGGGTPVPIPNTAVKPICAHDTWLEAARENRQAPTLRRPSGLSGGPFSFWLIAWPLPPVMRNCTGTPRPIMTAYTNPSAILSRRRDGIHDGCAEFFCFLHRQGRDAIWLGGQRPPPSRKARKPW